MVLPITYLPIFIGTFALVFVAYLIYDHFKKKNAGNNIPDDEQNKKLGEHS